MPVEALPFPVLVRTQMTGFEDAQKLFLLVSLLSILLIWSHMEDNVIALSKKFKKMEAAQLLQNYLIPYRGILYIGPIREN